MTKVERKKICSSILNSYNKGEKLNANDTLTMLNEFENHNDWIEKKGIGVQYVFVGNGKYNEKCFFIHRTDNTDVDISYNKCVSNPSKLVSIKQAGRNTIEYIIQNYKEQNVIFNTSTCSVTGEILTKENTHIDHYDMTFDNMIMIWIDKIGVDSIYDNLDHSGFGLSFKCNDIKNDFITFHNNTCKLRAVTAKANLNICKL